MAHAPSIAGPAPVLRTALALAPLTALALIVGCDDLLTSQVEEVVKVTHTDPAEAEQGDSLTVQIFGEGFAEGDLVTWDQDGVPVTLIDVNSVTFVSETELNARIRIALDTDIGLYDVAVRRKRKKGVGSEARAVAPEAFEVKEYTPIPLGWVPSIFEGYAGTYLETEDINDHGVVVGRDGCCAFRWSESDGMLQFGGDNSWATSINNDGLIVGYRGEYDSEGNYGFLPFIYENDAMTDLAPSGEASAINSAGTIVGSAFKMPVVWRRDTEGGYGSPVELPLPAAGSFGEFRHVGSMTINEGGDIAGWLIHEADIPYVGFFWRVRTDGTYEDPIVLDGRGGVTSVSGINDSGLIIGQTFAGGSTPPVAVVWHPDDYARAIPLGLQTSRGAKPYDITSDFQVVGVRMGDEFKPYTPFPGGTTQATLWQLDSEGQTMEVIPLLPVPGYSDSRADAINADGWVVGLSSYVENNSGWVYDGTIWRPDQ